MTGRVRHERSVFGTKQTNSIGCTEVSNPKTDIGPLTSALLCLSELEGSSSAKADSADSDPASALSSMT